MREATRRRVPVLARADRARLAFLTSTHVVDDLYQGAVPALLPFLAIERHYSYAGLTGITLAATFLASVVQPGFGALTDRYRNLGWLVAVGLLVAGLGIGLSGLGDSYLITWFAVAASGVGVAAYHPEATRTARGMAGDSTQAMSWFSVGGNIGIALGPVIVTPVLLATRLLFAPFAVQVTLGQDFLPNRIGVASGVTLGLAVSAGGVAAPLFGLLADTYGLTAALGTVPVFPAAAFALTFLLRDPRSGPDRARH